MERKTLSTICFIESKIVDNLLLDWHDKHSTFLHSCSKKFLSTSRVDYLLNFLVVRLDRLHEIPINIVPTWFLVMLFISEVAYYWLRKNKLLILLSFLWRYSSELLL